MLDRLPASRRTGSRPLANFAVPAAVHAVLAAAALRATVAPPPPHAPRIIDLAGYIDPVTAPPSRPAAPSPAPAGADGIGPPPSAPILPVLSAPTGIPPVESFRGPEALRAGAPAPLTPARPTGPAAPVAGVFEANDERVVPPRFVSAGPSPLAGSGVRGRAVFEFVVDPRARGAAVHRRRRGAGLGGGGCRTPHGAGRVIRARALGGSADQGTGPAECEL